MESYFYHAHPKSSSSGDGEGLSANKFMQCVLQTVSKLLVNLLKTILPFLVSEEQSMFVSEHQIMDNMLLAQEILHSMGS